ncbi:hypothetical protein AVEN_4808-1 [Araneus ventricosus]|uniref:Uncharacterized protein n=1 Tax=Araneus ventricosus TaxID=182803 RepID=A0A4Y2NU93_ARAVE|nr:hypothetical protein AVEN_4808-1 [Araneus ventricosus]
MAARFIGISFCNNMFSLFREQWGQILSLCMKMHVLTMQPLWLNCLEEEDNTRLERLSSYPNLNLFKHVWTCSEQIRSTNAMRKRFFRTLHLPGAYFETL